MRDIYAELNMTDCAKLKRIRQVVSNDEMYLLPVRFG